MRVSTWLPMADTRYLLAPAPTYLKASFRIEPLDTLVIDQMPGLTQLQ